ncbi:MAG: carbohydrate ABC transporter substrate-binding protein [Acidimicrobiales bacterium]|nr:carbohydrate ABC transporter substrate-binding protein [Acidimicrobiales bacterium]
MVLSLVFGLVSLFVSQAATAQPGRKGQAQEDRVEVCHRQGEGRWALLSLPPSAVPAHLAHGDGLPLGIVPDSLGLKFDAACVPVQFTTVIVAGPEAGGADVAGISQALDALIAELGVQTTYVGLQGDLQDVIDEAIATGEPPTVPGTSVVIDILVVPVPGAIAELANAGVAVAASPAAAATATEGWSDDWLNYATVDGTLFAVPNKSDLKSLVWYKESTFKDPGGAPYPIPTTFAELLALTDAIIANGQTPWCVGIESGPATGWNFTDWVELRLLGSQPPDLYDSWVANDVGFDDPRIRAAWNEVLSVWNTPGAVFEGLLSPTPGVGIAETHFFDSVLNLTADDECLMHRQAQFVSFAFDPADARTFPFPADSADSSPALGGGTFAVALRPDIEVELVHEYLATPDYADARHAAQLEGFLSAVQGQDLSALDPLQRSFTEILQTADVFRLDASDLMPPEIGANLQPGGFWFEGTNAVIGVGQSVGPFTGKSVDDATQEIADRFCVIAPGDAC